MFIFYYAVLSEVSPPTALSPFAAAAITGGDPYRTTLQSWKYTLPAFVVPFMFVLDSRGIGLLMNLPPEGSMLDIILVSLQAAAGLAAFAAGAQNWMLRRNTTLETGLLLAAGVLLVFPTLVHALIVAVAGVSLPHPAVIGLLVVLGVVFKQRLSERALSPRTPVP
jgi:TRAP-type uncharacterized transport system fused permease subunit